MERLTFEGNFCDIAQCSEVPGGSFCEDGACSQKKVWERLKAYEDTGLTPEEVERSKLEIEAGCVKAIARTYGIDINRLRKFAEADRDGRVVVLPFKPGKPLLCKENILEPWLMKDPRLAVRYNCTAGIVFHMDYDTFCDLVKHDRITEVSEEAEKALREMEGKA